MPVVDTGVAMDGSKFFRVTKNGKLKGDNLRPHQAEDLRAALTSADEMERQSPQVKKPRELVEAMRIHSEDRLTAYDQALYEMLLAMAREAGIEKDWHRVSIGDIQAYLGVAHVDRVVESLDRIAGTLVTYDLKDAEFRKRGRFPLAIYEMTEDLRNSTAILEYMIPPPIRRLVKDSTSYARLEIGAFPRFKSKYSARLYPRLALRAGYDDALRRPWTIEPRQLADELGFPYKVWNYRHFKRDCLDNVMEDIAGSVVRFSVAMEEVRGTGRGRPVEALSFRMSGAARTLQESRYIPLTTRQKERLAYPDEVHEPNEMPSVGVVGRAVSLTGQRPEDLNDAWRAALDRAKSYQGNGPGTVGFEDVWLLHPLKDHGADEAFRQWVYTLPKGKQLATSRTPVRPAPPIQNRIRPMPSFRRVEKDEPIVVEVANAFEGVETFDPVVVDDPWDYLDSVEAPKPSAGGDDDDLTDSIPF